jgi:hypothetical protein
MNIYMRFFLIISLLVVSSSISAVGETEQRLGCPDGIFSVAASDAANGSGYGCLSVGTSHVN